MIGIRAAGPADATVIAGIRAQTWQVAYDGIIPAPILAGLTGPDQLARFSSGIAARSCEGIIVSEVTGAAVDVGRVVGFAWSGPERDVTGQLGPLPGDGPAGRVSAELYAIYVHPAYWSAGAGWELMTQVVAQARASRYGSISLWVLAENERTRKFYARAGFAPTGESQVMQDLGGVTEVRYRRPLPR